MMAILREWIERTRGKVGTLDDVAQRALHARPKGKKPSPEQEF
jgi:hypothetical protein